MTNNLRFLGLIGALTAFFGCDGSSDDSVAGDEDASTEDSSDDRGSGGTASGGTPGTGGDGVFRSTDDLPLSTVGPGESAHLCGPSVCDGSIIDRPWTLAERCDTTGTWSDPSCPASTFAWTWVSGSGTFDYDDLYMHWQVSSTTTWAISYPSSCGGCDAIEAGALSGPWSTVTGSVEAEWQSISCEIAGDVCNCEGTMLRSENYRGPAVTAGDAYNIEEGPLRDEQFVAPCASGSELVIVDEWGGHFRFTTP